MLPATHSQPRLILVDDNIRNIGGHFFELATLLLQASQQIGFQPVLATHQAFDAPRSVDPSWQLIPAFHTRRLVHWSLGVDGHSTIRRDINAKPIGGTIMQNTWHRITDRVGRPKRQPRAVLEQWSADLQGLLTQLSPTSADVLLINTGDDFALLSLAAAMRKLSLPPIRMDMIFHFAIYEAGQTDIPTRLGHWGRQMNACVKLLKPHRLHLHATTDALAKQMRQAELRSTVNEIPYPTRPRETAPLSKNVRIKAILAGLPRAEKGRGSIHQLLESSQQLLQSDNWQLSMQMPATGWQSMVPTSLHKAFQKGAAGDKNGSLEVMTENQTTDDYHQWLDSADIGLFLYQPERYVARCSGVLLEMMSRGIPVIVPDCCWLANQVRAAGGHRSIGFIYQDRSEIPALLEQFTQQRDEITRRARQHAKTILSTHDAVNTLQMMGLADFIESRRVA